jgi:hypothetical protein
VAVRPGVAGADEDLDDDEAVLFLLLEAEAAEGPGMALGGVVWVMVVVV